MSEHAGPEIADLSDEELVDRFRRSKAVEKSPQPHDAALEAELRRRGLAPDRENTIPDEPPGEMGGPNGPVDVIRPGPGSAAGELAGRPPV